ncbi:MAG TPA: T9SS C-terminal target domain-containing protein, partial [Flavobacteriales bacterium]|nr:T9SS C-terminal target domain-containing protein [Flavobacteriales bacterium]
MKKQVLTFLLCVFAINAWAYKGQYSTVAGSGMTTSKSESLATRAATCAPGTSRQLMEFNNVSALLEQGGLLFLDRSLSKPTYEVPKGSGVKAIYGNSLWMGGTDTNNNLRVAAIVNFRQTGNEFWAGPLVPEIGNTDAATCAEYDRFYYANRAEVLAFYNDFLDNGNVNAVPSNISNWPAFSPTGEPLAPFFDANGNGEYDPENGDMPWFQFKGTDTEIGCDSDHKVTMFGDQAYWWVFNDKGNIHSESGGDPLGMEVHAQAFAFNTDDEINDMTFYNYELINRTTQTLYNTYFGNFFDVDLGFYGDDFVGCDVSRGLGYVYNGDADDATTSGSIGYGLNPPAIGVDYFQGPFQNGDGIDNPLTTNYQHAIDSAGIPYKGIGIGYGDGILDNERFGMREFMMYNGTVSPSINMNDPEPGKPVHAYNYLQGLWRDGSQAYFGGCGYAGQSGVSNTPTDYMMFYDSDPYFWATRGVEVPANWREDLAGNDPGDRRFLQSSGPFTLEPGAYNNITVGIVYARSSSGNPFSSVEMVMHADDKAQALFDNCFKILEAPPAPDVTAQEMDKEIILMLSNSPFSRNANESYTEVDPFIILPDAAPYNDTTLTQAQIDEKYRTYRFEGYLIYQLANESVGSGDLYNPDKARLVTQVDVKNGIKKLVNWSRDPVLGYLVPQLMVEGSDNDIKHSFSIKTDVFTQKPLINHKTYYYMVMAYAYNEYLPFDPTGSPDGQRKPFIQSRQNASGA